MNREEQVQTIRDAREALERSGKHLRLAVIGMVIALLGSVLQLVALFLR